MNTKKTKELFESFDVVALKADKGVNPDAVEKKLAELGNPKAAIPFYAVYGPGIKNPITFDSAITRRHVAKTIGKASGGKLER